MRGFTLVELIVVVAIIIVLTAITVPSYMVMARHNRRSTCASNLKAIGQALALFREDYECFPPDSTEYLWTPAAVEWYTETYGKPPPGDYSLASPLGAAYYPPFPTEHNLDLAGQPVETGVRGLGLYTLYYLGSYATALPPRDVEPRLYPEHWEYYRETYPGFPDLWGEAAEDTRRTRLDLEGRRLGLNGLPWFRSSVYITKLETLHCPANEAELVEHALRRRDLLPTMLGWGNYDAYYRRNFWSPGTQSLPLLHTYVDERGELVEVYENRHLLQPYPPPDTVVLWCPYHRSAEPPRRAEEAREVYPGDEDLVLFADGSVRRLPSRADNRMFEESVGEAPAM